MADRLLVDLDVAGLVTVGKWPESGPPETVSKVRLAWPLDEEALEDLRWYLEDYLQAPYGVWEDRGPRIQARLAGWGEAIFTSVFHDDPARDAYQWARDRRLELVFRSASPGLLGLPWELMRDPAGPVALKLAGLNRALPAADLAHPAMIPGGRLRVLIVISRPAGTSDIGYRMIARPLLERLNAVRGEVDLVVLRPPTLAALRQALTEAAAAGQPFHVVHFDGHGALPDRQVGVGPGRLAAPSAEGVLVFERPGGGGDPVAASKVAAVLRTARVPVVVLNACQSGAVGKDVEAAVATRLVQEGCAAVVAMAYNVYAVAAAEFMAVFYERLFAGGNVTAAVTAGRGRLFEKNARPSPRGELPLADWLVPVHYMRREVAFPQAHIRRPAGKPSLERLLDTPSVSGADRGGQVGNLDSVGVFVGRDDLFLELESAARLEKVVVLHGPAGTGKTEVAKAFGRWWRDTGAVDQPEWVLWHSFEPGAASFGLDGVITETGLQVFGPDFASLGPDEGRRQVEKLLRERRLLLIWDNFEAVHSMPDPAQATPPLDDTECGKLKDFLTQLAANDDGKSAVVITSRTAEDWLGHLHGIEVGGLARDEAAEYAQQLLAPYPVAASRRQRRTFGELLETLQGHPLSMRLILPRLATLEPEVLLQGLRGATPMAEEKTGGDRVTSLAASITYSFSHLTRSTRLLLPAISLFTDVVIADVLIFFSQSPGVPSRFAGAGEHDWLQALDEAARVGLLVPMGGGMYRIHPVLPAYLTAQWRAEDPADHDGIRDAATRALTTSCATLAVWLDEQIKSGDAGYAHEITGCHRRTLGTVLAYALDHQMWPSAQAIFGPLIDYWNNRGLDEETAAWTDRILLAARERDGSPPGLNTPAGSLWLLAAATRAQSQSAMRLDDAKRTCEQALGMLRAQPLSFEQQYYVAMFSQILGVVASGQGRLQEAEDCYRTALAVCEDLGNLPAMAACQHHLGIVAKHRGRLDEGADWHSKALATQQSLGNLPGIASSFHQLGILAYLGERLNDAEDWHCKSLTIQEDLGNLPGIADSCHELGMIAQGRGRLAAAEDWYRRSLITSERLGDQQRVANSYGQLGILAEQRKQPREALEWTVRCVTMYDSFPHPTSGPGPGPEHLARLTAQLGIDALETCWLEIAGQPLPAAVREYVRAHRPRAGEQREDT